MINLYAERESINAVAVQRRENNKTPWHIDNQYLEVLGAAGELAARRSLGLPEILHLHFDHGVDFNWAGFSVDVKTTKLTPKIRFRYLQWPATKPIRAEIVLLMAADIDSWVVEQIGWIFSNELTKANINRERDVPCFEIPVRELRPFWELYSLQSQNQNEKAILKQCAAF